MAFGNNIRRYLRPAVLASAAAITLALVALAILAPLHGAAPSQGPPPPVTPPPVPTPTPVVLGVPAKVEATPTDHTGEVFVVWKPAQNATVHWIWSAKWDNTDGKWTRGEEGSVIVTGLEAEQDYWFRVIAGREISGETTQWSRWSNWAKATPKEQVFTIELVCINVVRKPCQELAATDASPGLGGLIQRVRHRTGGRVVFELTSYPELGLPDNEAIALLKGGALDMAEIYPAYVSGDLAIIEAVNLWGLYPDLATQFAAVYKSRDAVRSIIERATNGIVITEHYTDSNYIFSSRPLRSLDDFKGLRTRSYRLPLDEMLAGIGADPHFVDYFDVYGALEHGLVEAAISCGTCGFSQSWYEVAKYLYGPINGSSSVSWVVVNRDLWDEIPTEFQAIITEEGNRHREYVTGLAIAEWEREAVNENIAGGMTHDDLPAEIHEAIFQASIDNVLPCWIGRAGGPNSEAVRIFNQHIGPAANLHVDPDYHVSCPGAPPEPPTPPPPPQPTPTPAPATDAGGPVTIHITETANGPEAIATIFPCDGPPALIVTAHHDGGTPTGSSCNQDGGANFNHSRLVSSGHNFKISMACANLSSVDCALARGAYRHIWDIGFIERVKRRTNGQVQFEVTSFSELGFSGANSLRLIEDSTLPAAQIYPQYIRGDHPIVDVSGLWGLHPNRATNLAVIDAVQPAMAELTAANGGVQVAYMMSGDYYLFSRKEVHDNPRDWQGLKVRSHGGVLSDLLEGMGAQPQHMAYSDVYSALDSGAIDGAITCASCGYEQGWHRAANYIVGPFYNLSHSWLTVNQELWDTMPRDLQNIILEEGARHAYLNRYFLLAHFEPEAVQRSVAEGLKSAQLSYAIRDEMRLAAVENVIPRWVDRAGGPYSDGLYRINVLFNGYVYPIVNVYINPDGSASIEP